MPRLTIAIPTYNRAGLLTVALDSALAQTSPDIEILVSDNGSTDATPAVLAKYDDPRLRKMRRETTVSRAAHGTLIFAAVRTEFVLALSDDDYIEPEFAAEVLALFDKHPELSFVYTGCIEHYDDVLVPARVGPEIEDSFSFIAAHYANTRQVSWCACVTRVEDLRRYGPQPEDQLIGDMYFWTKIAFQGPVGCVARPLAHYVVMRPGGDNESRHTPITEWGDDVKLLQLEVLQQLQARNADPAYLARLKKFMRGYLFGSIANQFVWGRTHGMGRWALLKNFPYCFGRRGWGFGSPLPVLAAVILPRAMVRRLVLMNARRLAAQRAA